LDTPMPEDLPVDRQQVLRKVAFNQCMVFLLFASTLVLWPPLVTEIKVLSSCSFSFLIPSSSHLLLFALRSSLCFCGCCCCCCCCCWLCLL
jgi:hypothetical protein